ncbi:MAG TPA: prepilin-type N-terminal cleavage/methylation domain-containing protein [Planctomycetota bacterium]|nr:prepilin-type N-terminal cleavage/methylation domain-containing protein [Planctomycetota bacterium]
MPSARSRSGFTLYEVVITVGLLAVVVAATGMVSQSTNDLANFSGEKSRTETRARRALDRVVEELAMAGRGMLTPDPAAPGWSDDVDFQCVTGTALGAPIWGTLTTLRWERDPNELDDGQDNDGDGLVDEGRLVLVRNVGGANEQTIVLCTGVAEFAEGETGAVGDENGNGLEDERGFSLQRDGELLTVRLTLQEQVEPGQVITTSVRTSIRLRN